jgi:DNA-binding NarL/FixJ family response regulator
MSDASRKGRVRVPRLEGEACAASKLTEPQVRKIREEFGSGVSNKEIARRYEIPWQTIADVTSRRSWKCVE